jgi:hypothetical protein
VRKAHTRKIDEATEQWNPHFGLSKTKQNKTKQNKTSVPMYTSAHLFFLSLDLDIGQKTLSSSVSHGNLNAH